MPLALYDFSLDAGADWQRVLRLRDPATNNLVKLTDAVMEIRNSNRILALRLDGTNGGISIGTDQATLTLYISGADSLHYFAYGNYPGAVSAVGIWGIGRAYIYDLFVTYYTPTRGLAGATDRILRGFFYVDPNITQPEPPSNELLTVAERGNY